MASDMLSIERPLKPTEGIRVGEKGASSYMDVFTNALHKQEQDFTKTHKPYDRVCAKLDFEDKYNFILKENERQMGYIDYEDPKLKINFGELKNYGNMELFDKVGEAEDIQTVLKDGMNMPIQIGWTEFYVCKKRGHRYAVFIPIDEWNKRQEKENKMPLK